MNTLSPEAIDLLHIMLAAEVDAQVRAGKGDDHMSSAWSELYGLAVFANSANR